MRSEEKKMMDTDVQGYYQATSVAVNKRMLWPKGSMCGTKPSPRVTWERPPCSNHSFRISSRVLNLTTFGGTPLPLGSYVRCQGLIVSLLIYLWLRRVTFTATPMFFENLGNRSIPITRRYVLSFKSRRGQQCKRVPQLDVQTSRFLFYFKAAS